MSETENPTPAETLEAEEVAAEAVEAEEVEAEPVDAAEEEQLAADVDELEAVARERDEYLSLAQRAKADFENYRKRMAKEVGAAEARGVGRLVRELDQRLQATMAPSQFVVLTAGELERRLATHGNQRVVDNGTP